jgi:hypothetical protein
MRPLALAPALALALSALSAQAEDEVRHLHGLPGFSGEACAHMALAHLGSKLDAEAVFELEGLDPTLGRGGDEKELARTLEKIGFLRPLHEAKNADELWKELTADLAAKRLSAVTVRGSMKLVVSARDADGEVMVLDPDPTEDVPRLVRRKDLPLVRLRFEPGPKLLDKVSVKDRPSAYDLAAHCRRLRAQLPEKKWPVIVERPFVVTGDSAHVPRIAKNTVHWAVTRLKKDFFESDPSGFVDVWLFEGKESYEGHTAAIFSETPTTPYGYYSPKWGALIMNIATGTGTLVHEIVHPFVHENFRQCPTWLNEGLASLFEQCEEKEGHIHGRTNWRLEGLKTSIEKGSLPTFEALTATSTNEFYEDDRGNHYAQARYLCYYLQEKGLLLDFWRRFQKDQESDPTGYKTLALVLGEKDMKAFQKRWEEWALALTFP